MSSVTALTESHELSKEQRVALAGMMIALFDHWRLSGRECAQLLGLSSSNRSTISGYRRGSPLANNRDLLERAGHLLGIHKALRILFPHNRELAYRWPSARNQRLGDQTPIEYMIDKGLVGVASIRHMLDFQRGL